MQNYIHKKLAETIKHIDSMPEESGKYSEWITAESHLNLIRENAGSEEIIIFANGEYTYIDSIVVPNEMLAAISPNQLNHWHFRSYDSTASYTYGGGKDNVWIERGVSYSYGAEEKATQLVFHRTFDGWEGVGRNYIEVNQEYIHLTGSHWRSERRAYCCFDRRGDLEATVSVTTRDDKGDGIDLVTFKWDSLEEYLTAAEATLLRRFDFTLLKRNNFNGWPQISPEIYQESADFNYHRLLLTGYAAYTAGRQLIRPRKSHKSIHEQIKNGWTGDIEKKYAEFIATDWRNKIISKISTDPQATTNYFDAEKNTLPFELSPAFFRPEVLSKYKTDRDKYTIRDRTITCRTAWHLKGYDVNEAGQIHAYICDLRRLPYEEQLHWLSYNEQQKCPISRRALVNDFHGQFVEFLEPLEQLLSIVRGWRDEKAAWWVLRDEKLIDRVNVPLTASRDEWGEAFMDLAKLVVEGFETSVIRAKLDERTVMFSKDDRTIVLLEKLLNKNSSAAPFKRFEGLRIVQGLRSKVKGHVGGGEAEELAQQAIMEHETFSNHFKHVCSLVVEDLYSIEQMFA